MVWVSSSNTLVRFVGPPCTYVLGFHRCGTTISNKDGFKPTCNEFLAFNLWVRHLLHSSRTLCKVMILLISGKFKFLCYRPQRSCGKVMFSQASVILFTGGVWQTRHLSRHPPPGRHPPGLTPPFQQTAIAADDMHPTGIHSCGQY